MIDGADAATEKRLREMEARLSKIYARTAKDVEKKWKDYLAKIEPQIAQAQKEYDLAKKSGDAELIQKKGIALQQIKREKIMTDKHYKNLVDQTAKQLASVNESALAYINGELPKTYIENYIAVNNGIADTVKGYSFELVDQNTVKRLIAEGDVSLLPAPSQHTLEMLQKSLAVGADIRWNTRKINAEVLQGIMAGDSMKGVAERLQKVSDMNAKAAIRNARTMVTGAENAGRMDMLHQAQSDGIIAKKRWIAYIDDRTRDAHIDLDGQIKDIDEPFINSFGKIMYPGDPSADPANVYNCRCTLGYEVEGFR